MIDMITMNFMNDFNTIQASSTSTEAAESLRERVGRGSRALVVFQVPNEIGLGHMNRQATIALALRRLSPDTRCLFLIAGESHGFFESLRLPYVSIPSARKMRHSAGWTNWTLEERYELESSFARSIMHAVQPSLVVFDCFPHTGVADVAIALKIPLVLCIRNMRDYDVYIEEPAVRRVLQDCCSILSPHEEADSTLPQHLRDRAFFSGAIVKELPVDPRPVSLALNMPNRKVILITGGGGGHPETIHFLNQCIAVLARLQELRTDVSGVLVAGPLFRRWGELRLIPELRVLPFDENFSETCATADLVLAQAGYNSANELAMLGTPTLLFPAHRGFDDQFKRAMDMAASWPNIHIIAGLAVDEIALKIAGLLTNPPERVRPQGSMGAELAAIHLINLIGTMCG